MNKKTFLESRKYRTSLTLLCSSMIFMMQLLAFVTGAIVLMLLVHFGTVSFEGLGMEVAGIRTMIVWMLITSGFMGAILAFIIPNELLKPINAIINAMNDLAAGNFKTRIHFGTIFSRHPTVIELCKSFNTMAEELEGTEMLRSDFVNNFSHEFKTPIVSIAGFAGLLRREKLTDEEKDEYLEIIESESLRLSDMATNILNMTKIENQTILSDVTEYNLSEQLRSCVLLLEGKWSEKSLDINLDMDEFYIRGNEEMLKQVWINLLDNAVKFSQSGGTVDISIKDEGAALAVSIANTGSTIPEDKYEQIFRKFYQVDESHAAKGSGIGLAIVKSAAELHGGCVFVYSKDDYTVFTVKLPKER